MAESKNVLHLTEENFDREVLHSAEPVLVDFWAAWCGPCRIMAPVVDQLADEFAGRAKVAKVDVDAAPRLAARFGIVSIPTLMVFRGGKPVDQVVGAVPKAVLAAGLEKLVSVA